jgi:predicted RNA-binding protein Jag
MTEEKEHDQKFESHHIRALIAQHGSALAALAILRQHPEA